MRNLLRAAAGLLLLGWSGLVTAQLPAPSPLVAVTAEPPGAWIVGEQRAASAWQAGFPATAAAGYRAVLAEAGLPAEARPRLVLALSGALLDAGDVAAAEQVLQGFGGLRDSAFHLRVGLAAAAGRRLAAARAALGEVRAEELPAGERAWAFLLQAQVAELEGDAVRANGFYEQAAEAATTGQQRVRFEVGREQARLRAAAPVTEAQLAGLRINLERAQGTRLGQVAARTYAVALVALNRSGEAQAVLQRQLAALPATERETADQFRLLLGLIAGEATAEGRRAFRELLRGGLRPETQRLALHLLVRGARTPAERAQLRQLLTELLAGETVHPVAEDLWLARGQLALADQLYGAAEEDGRTLLDRFPGSALRPAALGMRLAVAWELKRYRTVADLGGQLRGGLSAGREHAELGVLVAEAFFRAGDFKSAGDAYEAALRETPQVVPAGGLIFQRVLAEVRAERLPEAAARLDEWAGSPGFDVVSRWQAEWNLVRALQLRGQVAEAQARVERLLAGGAGTDGVGEELRVRLLWLRAKLAFDNEQPEVAARQADELAGALGAATLPAELRATVAANAWLLKAQALLALGRDAEAGALLERLRADHRGAPAAVFSYLVQARRLAARGAPVAAQQLLLRLADEHAESEFAPLALYEAAVNAERQGLDRNLEEANAILERLVGRYPRDELVFHARLKQGDLFRKLNQYGAARLVYQDLINNQGRHPEVHRAELALGYTLFAQGGGNPGNQESAAAIFERLRDLPAAPVDLRVEAGYMWGYAVAKRAPEQALPVWWSAVDGFLLEPAQAARLGATGRYWLARTLLELGQALEELGRPDEAQRAYQLVVEHHLGGGAAAAARLARLRPPAEGAKP